jgi:hypothetical protein
VDKGPFERGYGYIRQTVKTTSRTWLIPYCQACKQHMELADRITYLRKQGTPSKDEAIPGFPFAATGAVLAVGAGALGMVWYLTTQDSSYWTIYGAICSGTIALLAAMSGWGLVLQWRGAPLAAAQQRDEEMRMLVEADVLAARPDAQLKGGCASNERAVTYSFQEEPPCHWFTFSNPEYVRLFREANKSAIVDAQ